MIEKELVKRLIYRMGSIVIAPIFLVVFLSQILILYLFHRPTLTPRFVWGSTPIINNSYWARAMRDAGFISETFVDGYFSINKRADFDFVMSEKYTGCFHFIKYYLAFFESLNRYDIFVLSCNGFFLGRTPLWRMESQLLKLAGKKIIVIPYGSDAFVYSRLRSPSVAHGLMLSYPRAARQQDRIGRRLDYWCKNADIFIPGLMGPNGMGRWDVMIGSQLFIDLKTWLPSSRLSPNDGRNGRVYIAHAPNHRGIKGSEFVVRAVDQLKAEGLDVELLLIEKMPNDEVRELLKIKTDILVEQLLLSGHGLNGLEGLASGLPVISNLGDENCILPFRRWSFFSECPIVSADPETLTNVLRKLVVNPQLRIRLGQAGYNYVEKYHGLDSCQFLFKTILDKLYGRRESLLNLYHPLMGEYGGHKPQVDHPLVLNQIVG